MKLSILSPLRIVAEVDSWPVRVKLFEDLAARSLPVKIVWKLYEILRPTPLGSLMLFSFMAYTFLAVRFPREFADDILSMAIYPNEKSEIRRLSSMLAKNQVANVEISALGFLTFRSLACLGLVFMNLGTVRRILRLSRRFSRSLHFVTHCRCLAFIAFYMRFELEFQRTRPKAVLVASLTGPEALGLIWSARSKNVKSIFSSHATIAPGRKILSPTADLCVLDGLVASESCKLRPELNTRVILKGLSGISRRLNFSMIDQNSPKVGIFLSAPVNQVNVDRLVAELLERFQCPRIIIRPHPVSLFECDQYVSNNNKDVVEIRRGTQLIEDMELCQLVFSGNSNVHLEVLKHGIVSIYYPGLDEIDDDYYQFVERGIVARISDVDHLNFSDIFAFYSGDWEDRFRLIDHGYLKDPTEHELSTRRQIADFLDA